MQSPPQAGRDVGGRKPDEIPEGEEAVLLPSADGDVAKGEIPEGEGLAVRRDIGRDDAE